ncbi:MAG: ImmA/IrrE family metallo-endopeptidase [Acidobacteriota bacterium]
MKDLYQRLKPLGFSRKDLLARVLPDWWEDKMAEHAVNRRMAEMYIGQALGLTLAQLADPKATLTFDDVTQALFKRWKDSDLERLRPAVLLASDLSRLVLAATQTQRPTAALAKRDAAALRDSLLAERPVVDLAGLVDLCWAHGIPVIPMTYLPEGSKKVDGMALSVAIHDGTTHPVIIVNVSGRDVPARVAWFVAHEMGHIALGHLGESLCIDVDMTVADDPREQEANAFATALIYGRTPQFLRRSRRGASSASWKAEQLERRARSLAREYKTTPAAIALSYAHQHAGNRWPVARKAINLLQEHEGALAIVRDALVRHVDPDEISPERLGFLAHALDLDVFPD